MITKTLGRFTDSVRKNRILFWKLILRYQQVILLDLEKSCIVLIKITLADQIKLLDMKIKENVAQYDLGRKAAKISAYYSNNLNKYEYLKI